MPRTANSGTLAAAHHRLGTGAGTVACLNAVCRHPGTNAATCSCGATADVLIAIRVNHAWGGTARLAGGAVAAASRRASAAWPGASCCGRRQRRPWLVSHPAPRLAA